MRNIIVHACYFGYMHQTVLTLKALNRLVADDILKKSRENKMTFHVNPLLGISEDSHEMSSLIALKNKYVSCSCDLL